MYEHITTIRVRYADTDQMNIVYYGNYAQYFEVGRTECIRELGFTYKEMELMGVHMPVVAMEARFLRPAHYDDLITIKTILKEILRRMKLPFTRKYIMKSINCLPPGK
jgi:acyl-CoA thioester hydrolase